MELDLEPEQIRAIAVSILLIAAWISVPLYLQISHGYSAIQVSFAITVIYFVGFKLWERRRK